MNSLCIRNMWRIYWYKFKKKVYLVCSYYANIVCLVHIVPPQQGRLSATFCWQQFVFCVISHHVTAFFPSRSYLNMWLLKVCSMARNMLIVGRQICLLVSRLMYVFKGRNCTLPILFFDLLVLFSATRGSVRWINYHLRHRDDAAAADDDSFHDDDDDHHHHHVTLGAKTFLRSWECVIYTFHQILFVRSNKGGSDGLDLRQAWLECEVRTIFG